MMGLLLAFNAAAPRLHRGHWFNAAPEKAFVIQSWGYPITGIETNEANGASCSRSHGADRRGGPLVKWSANHSTNRS